MNNILCPICKVDETNLLFVKNDYQLVKCCKCNLIYVNPQPSDDVIHNYYQDNYGEMYIHSPRKMKSKFRDARRDINRLIKLKKIPKVKFLDVGCSYGYIVKTAYDYGWEASGIDLSENSINFAIDNFGINVQVADIFQIKKQNYFDFITMFDVIEHTKDPFDYLKKVYSLINEGGYLTIGTPDVGHYKARDESWGDYQPPEHLFYFDLNTLRRVCEMVGFKFVKKYIRSPFRATIKLVFQK